MEVRLSETGLPCQPEKSILGACPGLLPVAVTTESNLGRKGFLSSNSLQSTMRASEGQSSGQKPGGRNRSRVPGEKTLLIGVLFLAGSTILHKVGPPAEG